MCQDTTALYMVVFPKILGHGPPMLVYWALSWVLTIFNYNQTIMGLNRLGQMSLLAIESDILKSITNNVVDYFA